MVSGNTVPFVSGNIRTKLETKMPSIPHTVLGMYHALAPYNIKKQLQLNIVICYTEIILLPIVQLYKVQ
jgi:hypothetical protein